MPSSSRVGVSAGGIGRSIIPDLAEARTMLLLGATGFSGSHLREAAERAGHRVIGTSRSGEGAELACDLLDPDRVEAAVAAAKPELVANMAGLASVARSWGRHEETFAV